MTRVKCRTRAAAYIRTTRLATRVINSVQTYVTTKWYSDKQHQSVTVFHTRLRHELRNKLDNKIHTYTRTCRFSHSERPAVWHAASVGRTLAYLNLVFAINTTARKQLRLSNASPEDSPTKLFIAEIRHTRSETTRTAKSRLWDRNYTPPTTSWCSLVGKLDSGAGRCHEGWQPPWARTVGRFIGGGQWSGRISLAIHLVLLTWWMPAEGLQYAAHQQSHQRDHNYTIGSAENFCIDAVGERFVSITHAKIEHEWSSCGKVWSSQHATLHIPFLFCLRRLSAIHSVTFV